MSEPHVNGHNFLSQPTLSTGPADNATTDENPPADPLTHRQQLRDTIRAEKHAGLPRETAELIRFAQKWIPYGGPPPDEVLVQFGMTRTRFSDALRQAIHHTDCDPGIAHRVHSAYFAGRSNIRNSRPERHCLRAEQRREA